MKGYSSTVRYIACKQVIVEKVELKLGISIIVLLSEDNQLMKNSALYPIHNTRILEF